MISSLPVPVHVPQLTCIVTVVTIGLPVSDEGCREDLSRTDRHLHRVKARGHRRGNPGGVAHRCRGNQGGPAHGRRGNPSG